jgi:hypothetical protein
MNSTSVTAVQRKSVSLTAAIKDIGEYFKPLKAGSKAQKHGQRTKPASAVDYSAHGL